MAIKLLFSVVDFKMFSKEKPDLFWFDLEDISSFITEAKIVPLFNTYVNAHHGKWDDGIAAEVKIIVNLVKTTYIEKKVIKEELISYEALLDQFDSERHVYEVKVDFDIENIKKQISADSVYTINLSYILSDLIKENDDVLNIIDSNTFFSTAVPFSQNGGWFRGNK